MEVWSELNWSEFGPFGQRSWSSWPSASNSRGIKICRLTLRFLKSWIRSHCCYFAQSWQLVGNMELPFSKACELGKLELGDGNDRGSGSTPTCTCANDECWVLLRACILSNNHEDQGIKTTCPILLWWQGCWEMRNKEEYCVMWCTILISRSPIFWWYLADTDADKIEDWGLIQEQEQLVVACCWSCDG